MVGEIPGDWLLGLCEALGLGVAVYRAVDGGEDFELTYVNPHVERLEGVTSGEVLGRRVTEVFPGVEEMGLLQVLRRVYRTRRPEHLPETLYRDQRRAGWRTNYVLSLDSGEVVAVYRGEDPLSQRYFQALHHYTVEITRAPNLLAVAEKTLEAVREVLGYTLAGFLMVEGGWLTSLAMMGVPEGTTFSVGLDQRSVMVRAVRTGETQLVPDTRADPDFIEGPRGELEALLSELAVPVKVGDRVRAVINIEDGKPGAFTELDRLYVEALARYVSSAMERLEALGAEERHSQRLTALNKATERLSRAQTVEELVGVAMEIMAKEFGYAWAGVAEVLEDGIRYTASTSGGVVGRFYGFEELGVITRVVRTGETQLVEDTRADPDYVAIEEFPPLLSELAVPVMVEGRVAMVLNLESTEPQDFSGRDVVIMELLARHLSENLRRLQAEEAERRYTERLERLSQAMAEMNTAGSVEELAKVTLRLAEGVIETPFTSFQLVEDGSLKDVATRGPPFPKMSMPLNGSGVTVRAAKTGETQLVPDTRLDPDYVAGGIHGLSELAVPMFVRGEVVGVLNSESLEPGFFDEHHASLMEALAANAASNLERLRAERRAREYTERLERLSQAMAEMNTAGSVEELAEVSLRLAEEIIGAPYTSFMLVQGEELVSLKRRGLPELEPMVVKLPLDGPGLTVKAVKLKRTVLVRDTRQDPDYVKGSLLTFSELDVPLFVNGEVVGVLNSESLEPGFFDEHHASLMEALAAHAASNLERLRAEREIEEYLERLERLSRVMAEMNTAGSVEELAEVSLRLAEEIIGAPFTAFMLVENGELVTLNTRGAPLLGLRLPLDGRGITVRAVKTGETQLVEDTRADPDFIRGSTDSLSELAVPMFVGGEVVGVLNTESLEPGYFDEHHVRLMEALAAHAASNLDRLWTREEAEEAWLNAELERLKAEEAERLSEAKTWFIRTATHELRTPLTSILGFLELFWEEAGMGLEEHHRRYIETVIRNAKRLESLTNDLLDLQRIESGRLELEKTVFDVGDLVERVVGEQEPLFESRGQMVVVEAEGGLEVSGDPLRVGQVLVNLLSNASKYSPEGGRILVRVADGGGEALVSVEDEGVGIRAEDMPKLFEPFPGIRVPGVKDSVGLGLSICRGIVELHGGRIWAESEGPGKGARFTFTLPKTKTE